MRAPQEDRQGRSRDTAIRRLRPTTLNNSLHLALSRPALSCELDRKTSQKLCGCRTDLRERCCRQSIDSPIYEPYDSHASTPKTGSYNESRHPGAGLLYCTDPGRLRRRPAPPGGSSRLHPVPVFTWTGIYAGFNAGYAWSNDRLTTRALDPTDLEASAVINGLGLARQKFDAGGLHRRRADRIQFQFTPGSGLVVGFEADAQYTDLKRRRSSTFFAMKAPTEASRRGPSPRLPRYGDEAAQLLGTVRGRLGYAWDRVLVYGTAASLTARPMTGSPSPARPPTTAPAATAWNATHHTRAIARCADGLCLWRRHRVALPTDSVLNFFRANAITLKVEYLHYDLGSRTLVDFGVVAPVDAAGEGRRPSPRFAPRGNIVRAGLNYKFGSY